MFEIGQRVICIKNHSQNVVQEGKIYTIYSIQNCSCNLVTLDVGVSTVNKYNLCNCKRKYESKGVHWVASDLFKPLDETFAESVLENILEQIREEELELV